MCCWSLVVVVEEDGGERERKKKCRLDFPLQARVEGEEQGRRRSGEVEWKVEWAPAVDLKREGAISTFKLKKEFSTQPTSSSCYIYTVYTDLIVVLLSLYSFLVCTQLPGTVSAALERSKFCLQ